MRRPVEDCPVRPDYGAYGGQLAGQVDDVGGEGSQGVEFLV